MDYIETPRTQTGRVAKNKTTKKETKKMETPKSSKAKYSKSRGEHIKDIVIAMLVTGIITFIGGVQFQASQQRAIENAVKGAQTTEPSEVKK